MSLPRRFARQTPAMAIDSLFLGILFFVTGGIGLPFAFIALAVVCRDRARSLLRR